MGGAPSRRETCVPWEESAAPQDETQNEETLGPEKGEQEDEQAEDLESASVLQEYSVEPKRCAGAGACMYRLRSAIQSVDAKCLNTDKARLSAAMVKR